MNRESKLYKTRRKLQVLASYIVPNEVLSKIYSRIAMKKNVNLKCPQTFNEKIQWLKLNYYDNNSLIIQCSDKYSVRKYVQEKGLSKLLVPLIGHWKSEEQIDWETLPSKFILKCTHGCAYNILCKDKEKMDEKKVKRKLKKWLNEDFGRFNLEKHYSKINPSIVCEENLGDNLKDFKFFCFNGRPEFMYVSENLIDDNNASMGFFMLNGDKIPVYRDHYSDLKLVDIPNFFDEMLASVKILCEDFCFVRVDMFVLKDSYYFSELTFTPGGGMMDISPDSYDLIWGKMLNISDIVKGK